MKPRRLQSATISSSLVSSAMALSVNGLLADGRWSRTRAATTLLLPMPIYEYRCKNGHTFEVIQRMADDPVETCEVCGAPVERVFHPVAVHFKGSGFYTTDYAKKAKAGSRQGRTPRATRSRLGGAPSPARRATTKSASNGSGQGEVEAPGSD